MTRQPIVRAYELRQEGIDPPTISRAVKAGALTEASKKVPRGVVAMVSALAYHDLTDQMPRKVWMAVSVQRRYLMSSGIDG